MEFIARQPIFNLQRAVTAYELLYRNSEANYCVAPDLDVASRQMMATVMLIGFDALSSGHAVYVNCTEELLCGGYPTLFPAKQTVLEVLETVKPNPAVVAACRELKAAGYAIALDDFEDAPEQMQLVELADIIKVDFRLTSSTERADLVRRYGKKTRLMLAEKVETDEEFSIAAQQGYTLFQGYFFCRPKVFSTRSVKSTNPPHVRVLRLLGSDKFDFQEVEQLIKADPALCFRLLRYLNSATFCFQGEICSILQAVTLLGESEMRKWLLLVSTIMVGSKQPELIKLALVRARLAELLAPYTGMPGAILFLLGLLSLIDAILELPLTWITEQLAVPAGIRSALLREPGRLRDCLDLVIAYESGDWGECGRLVEECRVPMDKLADHYLNALKWTESLVNM
jgi:c-di-GMP-related signal transduction protein